MFYIVTISKGLLPVNIIRTCFIFSAVLHSISSFFYSDSCLFGVAGVKNCVLRKREYFFAYASEQIAPFSTRISGITEASLSPELIYSSGFIRSNK